MAQSRAAGLTFARVLGAPRRCSTSASAKMSKSVGNVIDLDAVVERGIRPVELRYYMLAPHYRARIDFSWGALEEAATAYRRIEGFVQRPASWSSVAEPSVRVRRVRRGDGRRPEHLGRARRAARGGPRGQHRAGRG